MEKSKNKKWIWITVAIVVVVAVAALLLWHFLAKDEPEEVAAPAVQNLTTYCGKELTPEDFLVSGEDASAFSAKFREAPDTSTEGEQDVTIIFTDEAGNETTCSAKLTVAADKTAPVIQGAEDLALAVGDAFDPMEGVSAEDDMDPDPNLTAVTNVKTDAPGEYTVRYKATDASGNKSFEVIKVTVS